MILKMNKSLFAEGYLRSLTRKSINNKNLEYFKRQIIDHLKNQNDEEPDSIEKTIYSVGTIRTWNGMKHIKGPDKKWRRYYDKEDRGARISIKNLIKKVETINSAEELMKLVMIHRDRFSDKNGYPIPIVQELSRYVRERDSKISQDSASHDHPAATSANDKNKKQKGISDFIDELNAVGDTYFSKQAEAVLNAKPNAFGGKKTVAQLIEEGTAIKLGGRSSNKKLFETINSRYKEYLDGNFAGKKDKDSQSLKKDRDIINSGKLDDWKAEYVKKNNIDMEGQKKLQEVIDLVRKQQYIMAYKSGKTYNFNNILPMELKGKFAIFLKNKIKKEVNSAGEKEEKNKPAETDKKGEVAVNKEPSYDGDFSADFVMGKIGAREVAHYLIDKFKWDINHPKTGLMGEIAPMPIKFNGATGQGWEKIANWIDGIKAGTKDKDEFPDFLNAFPDMPKNIKDRLIKDTETNKDKDENKRKTGSIRKAIDEVIIKYMERKNRKRSVILQKSNGTAGLSEGFMEESIESIAPFVEEAGITGAGEKVVAVDFDGVINSYKSGWRGASATDEPVLSAAESLHTLYNRGYKVIIFSTRANTKEGVETIREYLRKHTENNEIADSIEITSQKPIADMYIDDRAIPFTGDWAETLKQIEEFKPWTEKSLTFSGYPLQGRIKIHGMDISIENKKGSTRSGTDKDGHEWHTEMNYDYGYIRGTVGVDKDHLDVYIGPNPESEIVYIVNQNDPVTGDFDEQKVMLGFNSEADANAAYLRQYDRPGFLGAIVKMDIDTFKETIFDKNNKGKRIEKALIEK
jgi:hypothetical protein